MTEVVQRDICRESGAGLRVIDVAQHCASRKFGRRGTSQVGPVDGGPDD